jgi:GDP-4-dehydro-6-deoxy-D-mannose reductase
MKALVTGATGFAGHHLCALLEQQGDEVVALDRRSEPALDVTDRASVLDAFEAARPDVVYHLAAYAHVGDSWSEPDRVTRVNVEGTVNVLDASQHVDAQRVLVVGSAAEYAGIASDQRITEDTPVDPITPYGASKAAAAAFARQAFLASGLPTIRTRAFNHAGPGQQPTFLVPALAKRIARAEADGSDEVAVGSLEPVREVNDVRDVVRAYRLLVERGTPGDVYNVCSGRGYSVREIVERLVAMATRPLRIVVDPALVRPVDVPSFVGDPTKLRAATGYEPQYALDETLAAALDEARFAVRSSSSLHS